MKYTKLTRTITGLLTGALLLFTLSPIAEAQNFPIEFKVQVNAEKQAAFKQEILDIYNSLPSKVPSLSSSGIKKVVIISPEESKKVNDGQVVLGFFEWRSRAGSNIRDGELYLSSEIYENVNNAKATIAHEMLHSFVPVNGDDGTAVSKLGVYEEMLVEYYSVLNYGVSERRDFNEVVGYGGYGHLVNLVPRIKDLLVLSGESNPDKVLQDALFTTKGLRSIDVAIGEHLTDKNFMRNLGAFLDYKESKSNISGATNYLNEVERKLRAASTVIAEQVKIKITGLDSAELSNIVIPKDGLSRSFPLQISLDSAPTKDVALTVKQQGALVVTYSGGNNLVFTPQNYAEPRFFTITYESEKNTTGTRAEIILSGEGAAPRTITIVKEEELDSAGSVPTEEVNESASSTTGQTSTTGGPAATITDSFRLLPPCLRTADAAQKAGIECVQEAIAHYTSLLLFLIALGSFVYFLYGAFLYSSSFGEDAKITQAKKTITYALVGIVLATLAWALVAVLKSILKA